jgi:Fe-S cluster biogenesis protein NfuA
MHDCTLYTVTRNNSSTMTMKMGLERRLVEKIPEISEVVQSMPEGPQLNVEEIEKVTLHII